MRKLFRHGRCLWGQLGTSKRLSPFLMVFVLFSCVSCVHVRIYSDGDSDDRVSVDSVSVEGARFGP